MGLKQKSFIVLLQIIIVGLLTFVYQDDVLPNAHTNRVFGDLTADFGVGKHEPMFQSEGLAVGESEVRRITIVNEGTDAKQVFLKGILAGNTLDTSGELEITIEDQEIIYYGSGSNTGKKTVKEFFADSDREEGIVTTILAPGKANAYFLTVSYPAVPEYKGKKVKAAFDLEIRSKAFK